MISTVHITCLTLLLLASTTVLARPQIPAALTRWWHGPGWTNPAKICAKVSGQQHHVGPAIIEARIEEWRNPAGKNYEDTLCDYNLVSWAISALNTDDCDTRVSMEIDTDHPMSQSTNDNDWKVVIKEWDDSNDIYYGRGSPKVGDKNFIDTIDKKVVGYTMANIRVKLTDVDKWTFDNTINKFNCYYDAAPAEAECLAEWQQVRCCTAMSGMDDDVNHSLTISVRSYIVGNQNKFHNCN